MQPSQNEKRLAGSTYTCADCGAEYVARNIWHKRCQSCIEKGRGERQKPKAKTRAREPLKELPKSGFIRPAELAGFLRISVNTIWRRVHDDTKFPKPRKLSPKVTVFDVGEVSRYIEGSAG